MAKVAFTRSAGYTGDLILVIPSATDEEVGRVHRLVAAARKALLTADIPFQVADVSEVPQLMAAGDPARTIVIDLDLLHDESVGLLNTACGSAAQVVGYKLHQGPSGARRPFLSRGDSNAALAGQVARRLTESGLVGKTSLST